MTNETNGAVIDRLFDALSRGDVAAAMACLTPNAVTWHGFDDIVQDQASIRTGWEGFIAAFPGRSFINARRSAIPGGFVQQHLMIGTMPDGERRFWPICIVVQVEDGLITRLDEYVDRAGSFPLSGEVSGATPGLGTVAP